MPPVLRPFKRSELPHQPGRADAHDLFASNDPNLEALGLHVRAENSAAVQLRTARRDVLALRAGRLAPDPPQAAVAPSEQEIPVVTTSNLYVPVSFSTLLAAKRPAPAVLSEVSEAIKKPTLRLARHIAALAEDHVGGLEGMNEEAEKEMTEWETTVEDREAPKARAARMRIMRVYAYMIKLYRPNLPEEAHWHAATVQEWGPQVSTILGEHILSTESYRPTHVDF